MKKVITLNEALALLNPLMQLMDLWGALLSALIKEAPAKGPQP